MARTTFTPSSVSAYEIIKDHLPKKKWRSRISFYKTKLNNKIPASRRLKKYEYDDQGHVLWKGMTWATSWHIDGSYGKRNLKVEQWDSVKEIQYGHKYPAWLAMLYNKSIPGYMGATIDPLGVDYYISDIPGLDIPFGSDDYQFVANLKIWTYSSRVAYNNAYSIDASLLIDEMSKQLLTKKDYKKWSKGEKAFVAFFKGKAGSGGKDKADWAVTYREILNLVPTKEATATAQKMAEKEGIKGEKQYREEIRKKINAIITGNDPPPGQPKENEFVWVVWNDTDAHIMQKATTEGLKVLNQKGKNKKINWAESKAKDKKWFVGFEYATDLTKGKQPPGEKDLLERTPINAPIDKLNKKTIDYYNLMYTNPGTVPQSWYSKWMGKKQIKAFNSPKFLEEFGGTPAGWMPLWGDLDKHIKDTWGWLVDYYNKRVASKKPETDPSLPSTWKIYLKKEVKLDKKSYESYRETLANAVAASFAKKVQRYGQVMFVYTKWIEVVNDIEAGKTFAKDDEEARKKNDFKTLEKKVAKQVKTNLTNVGNTMGGGDTTEELPSAPTLSKEELEKRQRMKLQCALMMNMVGPGTANLKSKYSGLSPSPKMKHRGDVLLVDCKDNNKNEIINILMGMPPNSAMPFMGITPDIASAMTPKIRFFKVSDGAKGSIAETEFVFDTFYGQNKGRKMLLHDIDRGDGMGLKEFSFSFNGTTPATARKDIKAKLVMYFQSFQDFIKPRKNGKGNSYRFVDLLIRPAGKSIGFGGNNQTQYDPSYYRIRVDVGWNIREDMEFKSILANRRLSTLTAKGVQGASPEAFINSIKNMNKTYYLNMVEHSINVRKDGSIEITAEYQAYMESVSKSHPLDVLSDSRLLAERVIMNEQLEKIKSDPSCNNKTTRKAMNLFSLKEELLLEKAYRSLMQRLLDRNAVRKKFIDTASSQVDAKTGLFTETPKLLNYNDIKDSFTAQADSGGKSQQPADKAKAAVKKVKTAGNFCDVFQILPPASKVVQLNYFYLGDLIDVALDTKIGLNGKQRPELKKFKLILGTFFYKGQSVNIAQIPISTHYFFEWMTNHVISKKRKTFPLMNFIRTLTNHLVVELMTDKCSGDPFPDGIQFRSTTAIGPKNDDKKQNRLPSGGRSVRSISLPSSGKPYLNSGLNEGSTSNNLYHYIIVYAMSGNNHPTKVRNGNKRHDMANGVYHLNVGQNRGIVKSMSFDKTDIQYIREANFFRNGIDGLSQLGAVYNVTINMIGNTLFYPGMHVFLNPMGIGGIDFDPTRNTVARTLGFGGYHVITKVTNKITPSGFNTSVVAMWDYSGGAGGTSKTPKQLSKEKVAIEKNLKCASRYLKKLREDVGKLVAEGGGFKDSKK